MPRTSDAMNIRSYVRHGRVAKLDSIAPSFETQVIWPRRPATASRDSFGRVRITCFYLSETFPKLLDQRLHAFDTCAIN